MLNLFGGTSDPGRVLYSRFPALKEAESNINNRPEKRERIARRVLPKDGTGAEIGVFTGLFSPLLYRAASPRKLYLVDPWHTLFGEHYPSWGAYTAFGKLETEAAIEAVKARTHSFSENVFLVRGPFVELAAHIT